MAAERESNFELLRLVSMYFIVLYHLLMWLVLDDPSAIPLKSFWLPLHIGVICFVLISGYFRIRPSVKGAFRLIGVFFVFSLPEIVYGCIHANDWHEVLHSLLFISHSHYWFVKSYIGLYLFSPLINKFLLYSSRREQWYLLFVSMLVSVYFGMLSKTSLYNDGKNIINFLLIYQIGHFLKEYKPFWERISIWFYLGIYLLFNVGLIVVYWFYGGSWLGDQIWRFSFPYNSPLLLFNAIILFLVFGKLSFRSRSVNVVARGCFAVYLIHESTPLVSGPERSFVLSLYQSTASLPFFLIQLSGIAIVILCVCLIVYYLMNPFWALIDKVGGLLQESFR